MFNVFFSHRVRALPSLYILKGHIPSINKNIDHFIVSRGYFLNARLETDSNLKDHNLRALYSKQLKLTKKTVVSKRLQIVTHHA